MIVQTLKCWIFKLLDIYNISHGFERTACRLLAPVLCSQLGSVIASANIQQHDNISQAALALTSLGLNTDVSSGKLKLASMLYCVGNIEGTELLLRDIEDNYKLNVVEPLCGCYPQGRKRVNDAFNEIATTHNEEAIRHTLAYCVRFLPCEIYCIPQELKYEMFRSTQEDLAMRGPFDLWMDLAVVDSLPFLYVLQYKTYGQLRRHGDKKRALNNLLWTINNEPDLAHGETALNLLGQCMEQENRARDALNCYLRSLNLRPRNNAVRFHICKLLSTVINSL